MDLSYPYKGHSPPPPQKKGNNLGGSSGAICLVKSISDIQAKQIPTNLFFPLKVPGGDHVKWGALVQKTTWAHIYSLPHLPLLLPHEPSPTGVT